MPDHGPWLRLQGDGVPSGGALVTRVLSPRCACGNRLDGRKERWCSRRCRVAEGHARYKEREAARRALAEKLSIFPLTEEDRDYMRAAMAKPFRAPVRS